MSAPAVAPLAERIAERSWYHTLELAPGVLTPGFFDTRPTVAHVPLPTDLSGLRCLDVGTWDGFWAFEMERRGAASVTALDIEDPERWDWPPQARFGETNEARMAYLRSFKSGASSFALAKEALGSQVERVDCSVYDLDPAVHGSFDLVFMGSLLLHLRDPVRALDAVRSVCGGQAVLAESIELLSTLARPADGDRPARGARPVLVVAAERRRLPPDGPQRRLPHRGADGRLLPADRRGAPASAPAERLARARHRRAGGSGSSPASRASRTPRSAPSRWAEAYFFFFGSGSLPAAIRRRSIASS